MLPILALAALAAVSSAVPLTSSPAGAAAPSLYVPSSVYTDLAEPNVAPSGFTTQSVSEAGPVGDRGVGIAKAYIASKTSGSVENLEVTSLITDETNGLTYIHLVETRNGRKVANLVSNVNIDRFGNIISAGHADASTASLKAPTVFARSLAATPEAAVVAAANFLGYTADASALKVEGNEADGYTITGADFAKSAITATREFIATEAGVQDVFNVIIEHADW
ncbi:hypothetical protein HDU97_008728 [Phlyctochytrium planicorne]|nr:hypothetical protein HDU97_008728 [Phlyctochytrium planicorne]